MEAVKAAAIADQLGPFLFEDLPDRPLGPLRMGVRFRPGQTFIEEPSVQLVIAPEPQPRREEAFPHEADLVLDLPLLPSRPAGVQATGSTRRCEHIWRKRRLYWRSLPMKTVSTAVFMLSYRPRAQAPLKKANARS